MATATRLIRHTTVDHISLMACDKDMALRNAEQGLRVLVIGGTHIYLDADGITFLLEHLLRQPEASQRPELFAPLLNAAVQAQAAAERQAV